MKKLRISSLICLLAAGILVWQQGLHFLLESHEAFAPCEAIGEVHLHKAEPKDCEACKVLHLSFLTSDNRKPEVVTFAESEKDERPVEYISAEKFSFFRHRGPPVI